jgi:hypothetical protein
VESAGTVSSGPRVRLGGIGFLTFLALGAVSARAGASACPEIWQASGGPLPGGTDAADFGAIPETCGATELTLRLRATALVASTMPDYYGFVSASSMLRLRHRLGSSGKTWMSVGADLVTYRYVVNAVVVSDGPGFGPPTLGLHRVIGDWPWLATSVYGRVLLPLDTARHSGARTGFELGLTARGALGERAGLQGGVALVAPLDVVGGQTHAAFQPVGLVEGWWAVRTYLALFAGVHGRAEVSPDPTFLTLVPRLALRATLRHGMSLSALAEVPVVGQDRTDAVVAFFVGWAGP